MFLTIFRISICATSFLYTFYVLCNFTYFLSTVNDKLNINYESEKGTIPKALWNLMIDFSLINAFILQHSLMASDVIKDIYYKFKVEDIERSVYNLSTAAILQLLITQWRSIPWLLIWNFNIDQNSRIWLVKSVCHFIAWCIIYSGCIMMDISELAGVKQVYYKISGRPRPMTLKSWELQRYFMHMRHPSFTGFLTILWFNPIMTIDRFIFAFLLSMYMILMWRIDLDDYRYHSAIITRKERNLYNKIF